MCDSAKALFLSPRQSVLFSYGEPNCGLAMINDMRRLNRSGTPLSAGISRAGIHRSSRI